MKFVMSIVVGLALAIGAAPAAEAKICPTVKIGVSKCPSLYKKI
jgi:hypothetical protein